ncbi:PH domain-containing protein [Streptacidiphilus sp. N1-3]|uniref:PH domain-containing protein n=1 Tax=Streptacidiphilus alkalitolerans TaxID=3342712 RepID=A0ABV6X5U9_9ACTN
MSDPQGQSTSDPDTLSQETPEPGATAEPNETAEPSDTAEPGDTAEPTDSDFADRSYRSVPGLVAGGLLTALTLWLCIDAIVRGHGQTPWYGLASLVLLLPLFAAFTLWPVVRADRDQLFVRNPFRTITAPWSEVESIQAALSVELRAGGRKYQVWAIPVSLRQRKRAGRRSMMARGDAAVLEGRRSRTGLGGSGPTSRFPVGGPGVLRGRARATASGGDGFGAPASTEVPLAWADRAVEELRELGARAEGRPSAVGTVTVVWTWWVIAPVLAGVVAIALLAALG